MFTSANPFAVLDNRRFKGDPTKLTQPKDNISKPKKADETPKPKEKAAKKTEAAAPVVDEPVRKSKVLSLRDTPAAEPVVEVPKAVADPPPPTKKEREVKDRHEDRSAKGDRERKGGVGKGGWAEPLTKEQEQAEQEVRGGESSPHSDDEKKEEKVDAAATPEAAPEPEKPTYTLQEYMEMQKGKQLAPTTFKERKVDQSAFNNMVKATKSEESYLSIKKPTAKPAPKAAAAAKPAPKKPEEKKEKKEEKVEVGFYLEQNQSRGRGRRGRGRSDEATEEHTEGGESGYRGRGRGRGRGYHAQAHAEEKDSSFVLKNDDFPELPAKQ